MLNQGRCIDWHTGKAYFQLLSKPSIEQVMRDPEELTILAGLLDFYSDRATAHASFVVAAIFGVYTIFAIYYSSEGDMLFLSFPFLFLVAFELYSFSNFSYYAVKARIVRNMLMGTHLDEYDEQITDRYRERSYNVLVWFDSLKNLIVAKRRQLIVLWFGTFILVAQVLPWMAIWYSPIRETAVHFFFDIEYVHTVMLIFVLIPLIITGRAFAQRYWKSKRSKQDCARA